MIHCLVCGTETTNPKYCSRSCAAKLNNRLFPKRQRQPSVKFCRICNESTPGPQATLCSNCRKGRRRIPRCPWCNKETQVKLQFCNDSCRTEYGLCRDLERLRIQSAGTKGYFRVWLPDHPNADKRGRVLLHRLVAEWKFGDLSPDFHVHHIDENPLNNSDSNLEILSPEEHTRRHRSTGRTIVTLICPSCGESFEKERRNTHLVKPNQKYTYCSRQCSGRGRFEDAGSNPVPLTIGE